MAFVSRRSLIAIAVLALAASLAVFATIWSGVYDVAADDPHTRPVHALLETVRDRSIDRRAAAIPVPADLDDAARVTQGAGNYAAMCASCHLAPGSGPTELSAGLSPAPPDLTQVAVEPARAFWAITHGIKASGMPAWGRSMDAAYVWNLVAFLQRLPTLDAAQYRALVDASDGHSHGGGETGAHPHGPPPAAAPVDAVDEPTHDHATHDHGTHDPAPPEAATPPAGEAHDHSDHEH